VLDLLLQEGRLGAGPVDPDFPICRRRNRKESAEHSNKSNGWLTGGVTSEGVLTTETGRQCTLLEGIHQRVWRSEERLEDDPHTADQLGQEQGLGSLVQGRGSLSLGETGRDVIFGELFTVRTVIVRVLGLNASRDVEGASDDREGNTRLNCL